MAMSESRRARALANVERAEHAELLSTRVLARIVALARLSTSGFLLGGVVVAAWVIGRLIGGEPLYVLAYGSLGLLVYALIASRRAPKLIGTRGQVTARAVAGSEITVPITVTCNQNVSTVIVEEALPPILGESITLPIARVGPDEPAEHEYTVLPLERGVYQLGPMRVRWGDSFGLSRRERVIAEPIELIVHPSYESLVDRPLTRMWEDPPQRPPISKPWPQGGEFYGMRPYEVGDDVRSIVWRAYARTRELMVREAEQGITDKVVILLDTGRDNHSSGVISESLEAGVRAAASLAHHHLANGYSVTIEGNAGQIAPSTRSGPSRTLLLDELARIALDDSRLDEGMTRLLSEVRRETHVLIITPYLSPEAASRLELLIRRGMLVTVVALIWDDEHIEGIDRATAVGASIVEVTPGVPLDVSFRRMLGAVR